MNLERWVWRHALPLALLAAALILLAAACGNDDGSDADGAGSELSGSVSIDGSSTVFPVLEAVAEELGKLHRDVRVTVGVSGTGGGFEKFCGERRTAPTPRARSRTASASAALRTESSSSSCASASTDSPWWRTPRWSG
jgi:hypothetical protein